jgi:hypothetical protein
MQIRCRILCLILLTLTFSCRKIKDDWTTFRIKEGSHRSTNAINFCGKDDTVFSWDIIFDSTAKYTTDERENQYDINKLIGWSDCGDNHSENSIRFGWRWLDDSLEIHWFKHDAGIFTFDLIKKVSLCQPHKYELIIYTWDYKMGVDGTYVYVPRNCVQRKRKYMLYPYFGGNETAPHDITIKIKN